jgi:hypothetical protein
VKSKDGWFSSLFRGRSHSAPQGNGDTKGAHERKNERQKDLAFFVGVIWGYGLAFSPELEGAFVFNVEIAFLAAFALARS